MKSRGVVVVLALILATIATAGVFLYSQGVRQDAIKGGDLRDVIVSKVDIAANTEMDELIAADQFELLQVPVDAVVDGAVTDLAQLRGQRNTAFILAGEQIPISRVESGEIPGGVLGIPEGHQAISVSLDAPRAIAGALAGGDNVTIYATFEGVKINLVQKDFLKSLQAGNASGLPVKPGNSFLQWFGWKAILFTDQVLAQGTPGANPFELPVSRPRAQRVVPGGLPG